MDNWLQYNIMKDVSRVGYCTCCWLKLGMEMKLNDKHITKGGHGTDIHYHHYDGLTPSSAGQKPKSKMPN